jgi:hypothetical protein
MWQRSVLDRLTEMTLTGLEPSSIFLGNTANARSGDAKSDVGEQTDALMTLLALWERLSEAERARFLAAIGR